MGKSKKVQKYKTKRRAKRDKEKDSDSSSEGEIDETKLSKDENQSADNIQAAGFSPRTVKGVNKDKKSRHKSVDDIHSAGPSSGTFQGGHKGKKGRYRSVPDIQAEEYSPQTKKGRNKDKKGSFMSTGDIKAADYYNQTVKERNKDKKGRHKSADYIRTVDHSSQALHGGKKENKDRYRSFDDIEVTDDSPQSMKGRKKDKERIKPTSDIQATDYSPQTMLERNKDKKGRHKSADYTRSVVHSSETFHGEKKENERCRSFDDIQVTDCSPKATKGGNKEKESLKSAGDIQATGYSPKATKGVNKDKESTKSTFDIQATVYSPKATKGVNKDKESAKSTFDIQATGYSPQATKGGNKDKESLKSAGDIQVTGYSPQATKGVNKDKESPKSTFDIQATGYSPKATKGGNKDKERSSGDIQTKGYSPQAMKGRNKDKKVGLMPTGDIQAARYSPQENMQTRKTDKKNTPTSSVRTVEQSSDIVDTDLNDEELMKLLDEVDESVKAYKEFNEQKQSKDVPFKQYKYMLDSLFEHQWDLNEFFEDQDPKLGKHLDRCISMLKLMHIQDSPLENTATTKGNSVTHEEISALKSSFEDLKVVITSDDDDSDVSLINLEMDEEKEKPNDIDEFPEIQKSLHSPQNLVEGNKEEKGSKCVDDILTSRGSPLNIDGEKERIKGNVSNKNVEVMNLLEKSKVNYGTVKDSEIKPLKKMEKCASSEQNKSKKPFSEFQQHLEDVSTAESSKLDQKMKKRRAIQSALQVLREKRDVSLTEKETATVISNVKADEETELSKELAEQANDTIKKLEKFEGEEIRMQYKKDGDSSADNIHLTKNFPQNAIEIKKEGKKDKEGGDRSIEDNRIFQSHQVLQKPMPKKECKKTEKDKLKDKDSHTAKSIIREDDAKRIRSGNDFLREIQEFLMLQNSKLDEKVEEYSLEPAIKGLQKQEESHPPDKETVTATEIPTELQYESAEKVDTSDVLDADKNEIVLCLGKDKSIHFEVESNGDKHILLGEDYFFYKKEDKQDIHFDIKEKNINVSFIGSQIFISTENSEFEISVRDPHPVDLTDDATQTDTLQ